MALYKADPLALHQKHCCIPRAMIEMAHSRNAGCRARGGWDMAAGRGGGSQAAVVRVPFWHGGEKADKESRKARQLLHLVSCFH